MKISVINIGNELLNGAVVNTNLTFIGEEFMRVGCVIAEALLIPDQKDDLVRALDYTRDSGIVICTGGLGPTSDDVTRYVVAEYCDLKLEKNSEAIQYLESFWGKREWTSRVTSQVLIPNGATVLRNRVGTAAGMIIENNKRQSIILLPGPPKELKEMFLEYVISYVSKKQDKRLYSHLFYLVALSESEVEQRMQPFLVANLDVAYCASPEHLKLFISTDDYALFEKKKRAIENHFRDNILPKGFMNSCESVVAYLCENNLQLSVAESCTGGLLSAAITNISGVSAIFKASYIVYSNEMKQSILGVPADILSNYGAVSSECAIAMVKGVCKQNNSDVGIAITGIAGPTGGTVEKPVGLVYIAIFYRGKVEVVEYHFRGDRELVRRRSVANAFNQLRFLMMSEEHLLGVI